MDSRRIEDDWKHWTLDEFKHQVEARNALIRDYGSEVKALRSQLAAREAQIKDAEEVIGLGEEYELEDDSIKMLAREAIYRAALAAYRAQYGKGE